MENLPPELADDCFGALASTTEARLLPQNDHVCYELQRKSAGANRVLRRHINGIYDRERLVRVYYAADPETSPTRFIPIVSAQAIHLNNVSPEARVKAFFADISICDQAADGKTASQNATSTNVIITLDTLSIWLAILATKQHARLSVQPLLLTVIVKIWRGGKEDVDCRNQLLHALSFFHKSSSKLILDSDGQNLLAQEVWRLQHPSTQLDALLLWKSWLYSALRNDRILDIFHNKFALQDMCGNVMQLVGALQSTDPLRKQLAPLMCSLLLTWAFHYHYWRLHESYAEEDSDQQKYKQDKAGCDAPSCPCVILFILDLPDKDTLTPSPEHFLTKGIDKRTALLICRLSLLIHHVWWVDGDADHHSHRLDCLAGLRKLCAAFEGSGDREALARETFVISIAAEKGIEGLQHLQAYPHMDGADDEVYEIWNRLPIRRSARKRFVWEIEVNGSSAVKPLPLDVENMRGTDLFDLRLLRETRARAGSQRQD